MKVAVIRTDNFNILKPALVSCCSVLNMGTCSWHSNTERGLAEVNWFATKNKPSLGGKQKWVTLGSRRCFYLFCTAAAIKVANLSRPEPARSEVKNPHQVGVWSPRRVCVAQPVTAPHTHTHWPPAPVELVHLIQHIFPSSPQPLCASLHWPVKLPVGGKDGWARAFFFFFFF